MKYLSIKTITQALHRINDETNTEEHRTSTAATGIIHNYFTQNKYAITLEQTQRNRKKPDLAVELLEDDSNFVPHAFAELKRSVSDFGFDRILDQLEHAILETVDMGQGTFCVFAIVMKGTKIGLLEYYSYVSLLDDSDILNYKGFVPMTYRMSEESFLSINDGLQDPDMRYIEYKEAFNTERHRLEKLGVKHSRKLRYPYIFDLLNKLCS